MIPAVVARVQHGRSPELPSPNDERVVQKPPLLEILDKRRRSLIRGFAVLFDFFCQVGVLIPHLVEKLHEPHTTFQQASCDETVSGVV